jgi:hypothetical protein
METATAKRLQRMHVTLQRTQQVALLSKQDFASKNVQRTLNASLSAARMQDTNVAKRLWRRSAML